MPSLITQVGPKRIFKYLVFGIWDFIFQLLPYSPLRIWWLRLGGAKLGKNCFVDRITLMNLDRSGLSGLHLGADCYLGPMVILDLAGKITLGNQVTVTAQSVILSHHSVGYDNHPLLKFYPKQVYHTQIRSGSVLAVGSTILPGVSVGKHSLVAGGSLVNRNVPDQVMVAGVPAQIKKKLQ